MWKKGPVFLIGFSLIVVVFMGWVSLLPDAVALKSEYHFQHDKLAVKNYLSSSENWKQWLFSTWDPDMKFIQNGPLVGNGAGFKWFSKLEGDGAVEIKYVTNDSLVYELISDKGMFRERGQFVFEQMEEGTKVVWTDTLDVSTSFFARLAARKENFTLNINAKNKSTLQKMDSLMKLPHTNLTGK